MTIWADQQRAQALTSVVKNFETQTGATVKIVQKNFGDIEGQFITQAPTGNGPDIIVGSNDFTGKLVQNGVVAPITLGSKAASFKQVAVQGFTFNGQLYGLPYDIENVALVRNTKLAPTAPKTFQQAVALGEQLVKEGKAKFPFLLQQDPNAGDPYTIYGLQTSFDAHVFGTTSSGGYDPKNVAMCGAGGLAFANFLAAQGKAKVLSGSITADIATDVFSKGQAPFIVTGPWNDDAFTKAGIKYAVSAIPTTSSAPAQPFVGISGFFVSSKSKNPLLAQNFVQNYLASPAAQMALYKVGGRPPALTSAYDQVVKSDPLMAGYGAVGATGVPQPNIPQMDGVWTPWGQAEVAIIEGKGNPTTLWNQMCAKVKSAVAAG